MVIVFFYSKNSFQCPALNTNNLGEGTIDFSVPPPPNRAYEMWHRYATIESVRRGFFYTYLKKKTT